MVLRWKIHDLRWKQSLIKIGYTELDFLTIALLDVILEHFRKTFLEFQGNSFAHDAYAIDGVDQGLGFGLQNIANQESSYYPLKKIYHS